ncbi:MAG: hypothetical protein AAGJ46_17320 [Planctomycetota bacterium]
MPKKPDFTRLSKRDDATYYVTVDGSRHYLGRDHSRAKQRSPTLSSV